MADITMCQTKDCPIKQSCYRFTAIPNREYQSYFTETPYDEDDERCDHYIKTENESINI